MLPVLMRNWKYPVGDYDVKGEYGTFSASLEAAQIADLNNFKSIICYEVNFPLRKIMDTVILKGHENILAYILPIIIYKRHTIEIAFRYAFYRSKHVSTLKMILDIIPNMSSIPYWSSDGLYATRDIEHELWPFFFDLLKEKFHISKIHAWQLNLIEKGRSVFVQKVILHFRSTSKEFCTYLNELKNKRYKTTLHEAISKYCYCKHKNVKRSKKKIKV